MSRAIRATLGRLLFSQDEIYKSADCLRRRAGAPHFSKLMLQRPNVLVMDEPTNRIWIWSPSSRSTPRWKTIPAR